MRFENKKEISKISMTTRLSAYCPLGQDWYSSTVTIKMLPDKLIPDYMDVDKFIAGVNGSSLIIEDVVAAIYDFIMNECSPSFLEVCCYVDDAAHLPVTVTKSSVFIPD